MMRTAMIRSMLVAPAFLLVAISTCHAQSDDPVTWSTSKLYAHGVSLVTKGIQLNEAIQVLQMSVDREPQRCDYRSALASALASRFASIAAAQQLADLD